MSLYADRVKDTTLTTGTGPITLVNTAPTGYQTFATAFGATPQTVAYCIADQSGSNWEVGTGVFNGTTSLTRVTVLGSSNAGALVNFTSGTKDIFCTAPAAYLLPAGSNTQIQFNSSNAFGAIAGFSYDTSASNYLFNIAPANVNAVVIEPVAPTGSQTSTSITLRTKNASATNGAGGSISVSTGAGLGTGASGSLAFSTAASTNIAGPISFVTGNGTNEGGSMTFAAGLSTGTNSVGGNFTATAGSGKGTGSGGSFELTAGSISGSGTGFGGGFTLLSGYGSIAGTGGDFQLIASGGATSGSIYLGTDNNSACLTITEVATASQMGFFNATPVAKPAPTASGTGNVLSSVVTALNSLGLVSSAALTNASTLTAAGSDTQIQYNNAGAFGASSTFTYTVGTTTLTVPKINTTNIITNTGTGANGSDFVLSVGNASGTGYRGGTLTVNAGSGINGAGGGMTFNAGNSLGGNASGGGISFIGGSGSGSAPAGGVSMQGGLAASGSGGAFALYGGNSSTGTGGDCQFFPGAGPVANGSLILSDGNIILIQCQTIGVDSCMGFFEAAPVPQPTTATASATRAAVIGTVANVGDTYDGYTLAKVVKALRNLGILA